MNIFFWVAGLTITAFFLVIVCIFFLQVCLASLCIHKRLRFVPVWLPTIVIFGATGMFLRNINHAMIADSEKMRHIKEPLSSLLKKHLYRSEVIYTEDVTYLNTIFGGDYPKDRLKTATLSKLLDERTPAQAKLLNSLGRSNNFHIAPRGSLSNSGYIVLLDAFDELSTPAHPYIYLSQTGELGRGQEWCDASPEFRQWVKTLKPGVSVAIPTPENRRGYSVNGHFVPTD